MAIPSAACASISAIFWEWTGTHRMIIVGAGNIGRAVALSDSFPANGFETVAIFDNDAAKNSA